jgi:signal transduction histidine kinase
VATGSTTLRQKLIQATGLQHMVHRPPLRARFWIYCVAAYLIPIVSQLVLPRGPGLYDELVWLITLVPAFLLSLHNGLKGALLGLLTGTLLFIAVDLALATSLQPEDWRITVPIYIAYGMLAISVGWLSQELHDHYQAALEKERLAAVGQLAVTVRHELNNALTTIIAESQLLSEVDPDLSADQRASARAIYDAAQRIAADVRKLTNLATAPVVKYSDGVHMLDLHRAKEHPDKS